MPAFFAMRGWQGKRVGLQLLEEREADAVRSPSRPRANTRAWDRAAVLQDRRSKFAQGKAPVSRCADPAGLPTGPRSPAMMSRIGNELRAARERLAWDREAIAAYLRVRPAILEAIEEGDFADWPTGAYTVGILRSYARVLGLNANELARRLRAEAAGLTRKPELTFPAPVPERRVPVGAVVLLGALLMVGAYVGWYRVSANRPGEEPVRAVPQRLADMVQPPPAPVPVKVPPPEAVVQAPPPMALPAVPPTSAAAAIPAPGVFGPPMAATPVPAGAGLPPLPEGTRIVLRAKADAWLQVRDRQGPVLLNRVLHAGETWPVPIGKQLLLTTGNAGGTEVLVDGQLTAGLGNDGAVRRDLPLDPDAILNGSLTPPKLAAHTALPRH